ncbi:MAG: cytidylate kinase-like family protein [Pseudomonadales bacterium]|nr:cytidylate kinase-like family protein [Candidatus Woesebacteria bacterium]MCB9802354.1 cytidylate kinase-like family protein [Pseudomonadales bacterium]
MSVSYHPLVNKVLTRFRLQSSSFVRPTDPVKPFVTIAREPGSGGAPIAKAVAEKLGFEFVDDQIIDEIAKSTKKRKAIIQAVDEKSRSNIEDVIHSILNSEYITDESYISELIRVTLSYAHSGYCVILGRGANFITPFAKGLHVNISAPYDVRVGRAMDFEGLKKPAAKKLIAAVEKDRAEFVRQYFNHDISKKNAYDITINTQYFKVDEARDVIIEALYRKFSKSLPYSFVRK